MIKNIIFPIEFNHYTGGMLHSVLPLIGTLAKKYNVYILAHKNAEILQHEPMVNHLILDEPWTISIKEAFKTFRTYMNVRKIISKFDKKDSLIFTNNVGSELIFGGFGISPIQYRRVFVSRGGDYQGKTGYIVKKCFKSVDFFIAISQRQVQVLENININKNKIICINNGVYIDGAKDFKYEFQKNRTINISVLGYLMPEKNQELAIKVLPQLLRINPNIRLFLYGNDATNGLYEKQLGKMVCDLDVMEAVHFMGFQPDKYKIFSNTDILISTSLSEGFGRTIPEAMSFGIPCIGLIESGGLLDIITDCHDGLLIRNKEEELIKAIQSLIEDENFIHLISYNSRKTYNEKFTEEKMCEQYLKFIKKINDESIFKSCNYITVNS